MHINFLCIDDEKALEVGPLLDLVIESTDDLTIKREQPIEFKLLFDLLSSSSIDGLILDLRLDQKKNDAGYRAPFQGVTVAQELRTRMTEGKMPAFPIVLWSVDSKLKEAYYRDTTSHDLFDRLYVKDEEFNNAPAQVGIELKSLAKGYRFIDTHRSKKKEHFSAILGLDNAGSQLSDPRIGEKFLSGYIYPVHEYARYILRELIDRQGPLIDENVLAARLGVDVASSTDWERCKERLKDFAYTGVFSEAWPRWWAKGLEEWWQNQKGMPGVLARIGSVERVKFLKKILRLNELSAASPIEEGCSSRFWTICQGSGAPIDPMDGLRISCPELKSWQDTLVISIPAAIDRAGWAKGVRVHPLERERFAAIKKDRN